MMEIADRIAELILKYLAGSIDSAELNELEAWKNVSDQNLQYFNDRISKPELFQDFVFYEKKEQELEGMKMHIPWDSFSKEPILPRVHIFSWKRISVAASIIFILSIGILFGVERYKGNKPPINDSDSIISNADIAPGVTKAILTLADGRKISIDNAKTGPLALQGRTTISNENGAINYIGKATPELLYNTLVTNRGEQSPPLTLSDGTKVWLNAASCIRFPVAFTGSTRSVEVMGEAYFEVAKDKTKPFFVTTGKSTVQVLGTHFNIKGYADENVIKSTLLEGSVKVTKENESVTIKPGQQAQVTSNSNADLTKPSKIRIIENVNTQGVIAWKNGQFHFERASIQTVLRELSRWYDFEVSYEGPIPVDRFSGDIQKDLMFSEMIKILGANIHYSIEGKKIIVKR